MNQHLSGLMDGEIEGHADDAIDQLLASQDLRDKWWRYHLISEAMKRNLSDPIDKDLAGRIAAANTPDAMPAASSAGRSS